MPIIRRHGTWDCPLAPADMLGGGSLDLEASADGGDVYWLESVADEGGATALMRRGAGADGSVVGGAVERVTPPGVRVRSRLREYGGGSYAVRAGIVLYVDDADGRVWLVEGSRRGPITPVVADRAVRFAAMEIDPVRRVAWTVREDHRDDGVEPVDSLVRLELDGPNDEFGVEVVAGRRRPLSDRDGGRSADPDFVGDPTLSPDGSRLAWVQWSHPDMPWDATELVVARIDDDGDLVDRRVVAGHGRTAASCPGWLDETRLAYLDEVDGFGVPHVVDLTGAAGTGGGPGRPVVEERVEYGLPPWVQRMRPLAALPDGRLAAVRWIDGFGRVIVVDPATGRVSDLAADLPGPITAAQSLSVATGAGGVRVVCQAGSVARGWSVVSLPVPASEPAGGDASAEVLYAGATASDPAYLSVPQTLTWTGADGQPTHGIFYPPTNPDFAGPAGELPPLMVLAHGGPTSAALPIWKPATTFFTSRGIAVLDVNYAGSTGYGRAYRERLIGRWGVLDVADCVAGAGYAAACGLVDAGRMAIRGKSAGGFVAVAAVTFHEVFGAAIVLYGISDLSALAADTHKFESRYTDRLVAPWPAGAAVYAERSPIEHLDRVSAPMLILQGTEDRVVPPEQAQALADALRVKGLPVELVMFEGEGHGFRRPESNVRAWEVEADFLARLWGAPTPS